MNIDCLLKATVMKGRPYHQIACRKPGGRHRLFVGGYRSSLSQIQFYGLSEYCGRPSHISCHSAFDPAKTWAVGLLSIAVSSVPIRNRTTSGVVERLL